MSSQSLNLVRAFRRIFGSRDFSSANIFARLEANHTRCRQLVKFFYLICVFRVTQLLQSYHMTVSGDPRLDFVWPLAWAEGMNLLALSDIIGLIALGFALLSLWQTDRFVFRLAFAISLLLFISVPASLGGINHGEHAFFWLAACFATLPSRSDSRAGKLAYCLSFAGAQALLLGFYTLAGFWKSAGGIRSLFDGVAGNFAPSGLATTLADRVLQTNTQPLLADFVINYYWLSWPGFLFIIYAQLMAIAVVFRPSLHIAWGLILMAFHLGTFVFMEISFPMHTAWLMLFLLLSPFQRPDWLQLATLRHMPFLGTLGRLLPAKGRSTKSGKQVAWQR